MAYAAEHHPLPAGGLAEAGSEAAGQVGSSSSPASTPALVFLYQVQPGGASQSFGFNVARMAGLPAVVVARAADVAARLQQQGQTAGEGGVAADDARLLSTFQSVVSGLKRVSGVEEPEPELQQLQARARSVGG